jgi:hypothetical protein
VRVRKDGEHAPDRPGRVAEVEVLLEDVLDVLSPGSAGECPILTLDVGPIFLDLLGLQIETNQVEIDITAVAGEDNLLCAAAGLLDP